MGKMNDVFIKQVNQTSVHKNKNDDEEVLFGKEKVLCRRVDIFKEYQEAFKTADSYRKISKVKAHQATQREKIYTSEDAMKNFAEPGDWIIKNPASKDPYVFGDKNDPVKVRQVKFTEKYEPIDGEPGHFRPKGVIKAVRVDENIVFDTSWGEQMAVKSGGWVADEGYAMANFKANYKKIENDNK